MHDLGRALQIQRLEGSRPGDLWGLYVNEPVLIVCEVAVAVGALRFQLVVVERMVVGRRIGEFGSHNNSAIRRIRDTEPVCVPKREGEARLGDVDSCCAPPRMRRRSEEELRGGEPLDNTHDSAAERTVPQRVCGERGRQGGAYWVLI